MQENEHTQQDNTKLIDKDFLQSLISPEGEIFKAIPDFEYREGQVNLLGDIVDAFNNDTHLISEAGTGIGKSLAYLLPSVFYEGNRVLISTNTKTLQDQLFEKDIPMIQECLGKNILVVVAKGKGNYLCLKKIADYMDKFEEFSKEEINYLNSFPQNREGKEEDYPDMPLGLWTKVCVDDICINQKCRFYNDCFYFKKRNLLAKADIIICNHYLLACDLSARIFSSNFSSNLVLPTCRKLVVDEAHNFEDILVKSLTRTFSRKGISQILTRAYSEKTKKGLLQRLEKNIFKFNLSVDQTDFLRQLAKLIEMIVDNSNDKLENVYNYIKSFDERNEVKFRVKKVIAESQRWQSIVGEPLYAVSSILVKIGVKFELLLSTITGICNSSDESARSLLLELKSVQETIFRMGSLGETFQNTSLDHDIRWIETYKENIKFNISPIDIGGILRESVYPYISSVVYTSATLTFNNKFDHINKRLGLSFLEVDKYNSKEYHSPFDYAKNSMIISPYIDKDPNSTEFISCICPWIEEICLHLEGRTFILFTSFFMLDRVYSLTRKKLEKSGIKVLSQSKEHKNVIIDKFKSFDKAVLFGTSTFWEGIDIKGEKLQCVIIPRVPFQVPTDPLVEARMEVLEAQGGNAFMDFMVPEAVIKLKQGFGRLIRSNSDIGVVWFFDNRLYKKGYGHKFLKSLPSSKRIQDTYTSCISSFKEFFNSHL